MFKTILQKFAKYLCQTCLAVTLVAAAASALPAGAQDGGNLTVGPDMIIQSVTAGSSNSSLLIVSSGSPINITIAGLGQATGGAPIAVPEQQDNAGYTARAWVSLEATQFPAGTDQSTSVTISIPAGTPPGQRFASLMVTSWDGRSNILVPIILTVDKPAFVASPAGQITKLEVPEVYQAKPLHILTSFSNTGNCLITHAQHNVTVKNSSGTVVWQKDSLIADPSVMPGYPRIIDTVDDAGLNAGSYSVTSRITLATGQVYDTNSSFTVLEPIPPPATPVLVAPGSAADPGPVITTLTPTFQWNTVPRADYYELSISAKPFGAADTIYTEQYLTGTSLVLPSGVIWGATEYCWKLIASNAYGESSPAVFYFQTYGTPIRAITLDPTDITTTGAIFNANLLSLGTDASVSVNFEYGLTSGYGSNTSPQIRNSTGTLSSPVTGLTPNATYHCRVHVLGTSDAWGGDVIFTTLSPVPTIANISPAAAGAGATVTITGTNFNDGTSVTFNGTASPTVSVTSYTSLTATVPSLGTSDINNVTVTVTNSGGSATNTSFNYIGITQPPTINSISPSSAASGATITITGTNFVSGTTVTFNDILSPAISVNSSSTLTATVPNLGASNINSVTVKVTTGNGTATSSSFNYLGSAPVVTTNAASNITTVGATLNGNLSSLGADTSINVSFEYGTTTGYGQTTSAQAKASSANFSADVSGLTPNTTYHFRAKAVGSTTVYGTDLTFTTAVATSTPAPSASPTPTSGVTPTPLAAVSRSYKDYFPPVIDESSLMWKDFTGQQAFSFDAAEKTGAEVELNGTNNRGTLTTIAVRYQDEPQTEVKFSSPISKGGMGRPWIKFIGLRVEGATQGTARMTLHYSDAEISDYDPESLFLAYFSGGSWHKCGNIVISTDNLTVSGDIPIARLSGTAIGLGGSLIREPAAAMPVNGNGQSNGTGIPWSLAAIVIVPIIVIGGLVLVIERNRRRGTANG